MKTRKSSNVCFIDTNVFIAFANKSDQDHLRSLVLIDKIRKGEFGLAYTSDYIFDEAVTAALICSKRLDVAVKTGKIILGSRDEGIPSLAKLIRVDERIFEMAWATFKAGRLEGLSFTDHTILAQLREYRIEALASFDTGFDGLAARIS